MCHLQFSIIFSFLFLTRVHSKNDWYKWKPRHTHMKRTLLTSCRGVVFQYTYPAEFLNKRAMFLNALHFWASSLDFFGLATNLLKSPSVSFARDLSLDFSIKMIIFLIGGRLLLLMVFPSKFILRRASPNILSSSCSTPCVFRLAPASSDSCGNGWV